MKPLQKEIRNYCYRLGYSINSMKKHPSRKVVNINPFPIGVNSLIDIQAGRKVSDKLESKLLTFIQEQKQL